MHNNSFRNYFNLCSPPFVGIAFGGVKDFTFSEKDSNLFIVSGFSAECEPYEGMSYSVNNGVSTIRLFTQTFMANTIGMAINSNNDSIMYAVYKTTAGPYVYKTTNRGANWFITDTLANMGRAIMKVNPLNTDIVFLSTASGLLRSANDGYDFNSVNIPSVSISSMEFDTQDSTIFITSTGINAGIYRSDKNGLNWTRIFDLPCNTFEIDPLNNNIYYAGTNNGIYR